MHEATRRQYLALLGIEQWVPRGEVEAGMADEPAPAAAAAGVSVSAATAVGGPSGTVAAGAAPTGTGAEPVGAAPAATTPPPPATPVSPPPRPEPTPPKAAPAPAPPAPRSPAAGERVGCSLLALPDGLLVVAAFATSAAPGLTGPEHEMFVRLGQALAPGRAIGAVTDFHWPPRGVRVPGIDRPGEAARAFAALLSGPALAGARDVLLLGEVLADVLAPSGVHVVVGPSLATMLADPAAKRACWERAKPLLRPAP